LTEQLVGYYTNHEYKKKNRFHQRIPEDFFDRIKLWNFLYLRLKRYVHLNRQICMRNWLNRIKYGKQLGYELLFRNQNLQVTGKPGIILADLGMPEDYDAGFYLDFMEHVFKYSIPAPLRKLILKDRGIALIDPENPLAREPFKPASLVDMHGSFTSRGGVPYVQCKVEWKPPGIRRNPHDHGYFLYTGDGKGGAPEICQKSAAKIAGWYFGHLITGGKVPWAYHCRQLFEDASRLIKDKLPDAKIVHARYVSGHSLQQAVDQLLAAGCQTIIFHSYCNPVFSDFEEYAYAMPAVHKCVNGRAKVIFADQPGNQPSMRKAYTALLRDQLLQIPVDEKVLVILSRHGHPFKKETQDKRAPLYRIPLEKEMREVIAQWGGPADLCWSDDEYADAYWDPHLRKTSTWSAFRRAIEGKVRYAIEIPVEFTAENTDLMIFHAIKKYVAFSSYHINDPVHYPDWEQPLKRYFRHGETTGIYTGCPVGPYRKFVAQAVSESVLRLFGE
jgi:hypothetical protein